MNGIVGFVVLRRQPKKTICRHAYALSQKHCNIMGLIAKVFVLIQASASLLSTATYLPNHGAQPMLSTSPQYYITYSERVFNFLALSQELKEQCYRHTGHSDTEVMLSTVEILEITSSLLRFVAMFIFSLLNEKNKLPTPCSQNTGQTTFIL